MKFKFGDRVKEIEPLSSEGTTGTLVDRGTPQKNGDVRYMVRWDNYPAVVQAYQVWDAHPESPRAAKLVAKHIKALLYQWASSYPNLEYLVIVGDDRIIPHYRVRDENLIANERNYADWAHTPRLASSLESLYFLSDDYYAGLLPIPWRGRELFLPQVAIGRLVEKPSEIATVIDAFLAHPVIAPADALVTGYDFLTDQAQAISDTLATQGIDPIDALISDTWITDDLRSKLISVTTASDLNSLNAHFSHFALIPAMTPISPTHVSDVFVLAQEVTGTTDYDGGLDFSVGCHSGLNVPDEEMGLVVEAHHHEPDLDGYHRQPLGQACPPLLRTRFCERFCRGVRERRSDCHDNTHDKDGDSHR